MRAAAAMVLGLAMACGGSSAPQKPPVVTVEPDAGSGSVAPPNPDAGPPDAGPPDAGVDAGVPGPLGGGDWSQYRYDQGGRSENFATFTVAEAKNLTHPKEMTYELGQYVYTQAMITSDMLVFTTAFSGKVVALDPDTGANKWPNGPVTLNSPITTTCEGPKTPGFWAAPAIVGNTIYVASPNGNVYALRKSDGGVIWKANVADPTAAGHGEFIQSSPAVSTALGKLYVGVASSAHCDEIAGRVAAVDLATGAVQQVNLVNSGQQGAAVWSSISIAEDENRIYVSTGNRIGAASATPNSQAILAMDAKTLAILDRWQNPTTLENADFGSSPTLAEGSGLKLVAATSKDGWLYVLRRDALSAGPVWKYQIAVVDPADPTVGGDPTAGFGSISTPAFAHGKLFAAGGRTPQGEPGSLVAFDPATGAMAWPQKHVTPGYVIAPVAVAGDILAVESSAVDGSSSTLEVIDVTTGTVVKSFPGAIATYAAPSIGHGLILWTDAFGHAEAYVARAYHP